MSCVETYEPVCGNDGIAYPSECMMNYFACKTGKEIMVATKGKCQKSKLVFNLTSRNWYTENCALENCPPEDCPLP